MISAYAIKATTNLNLNMSGGNQWHFTISSPISHNEGNQISLRNTYFTVIANEETRKGGKKRETEKQKQNNNHGFSRNEVM